MRSYQFVLLLLLQIFILQSCINNRETASNGVVHIEDEIYDSIPYLPRLCKELQLKQQYIDIGNCKLYVEIEGEGIPIVLINGGPGGTHHCFHPWFSKLKKTHQIFLDDPKVFFSTVRKFTKNLSSVEESAAQSW